MSCALTQGYTLDCRDSIGGAKSIHFIETANITAITPTAGVITAMTKATGKRFWKYVPARDTAHGKSTQTINVQNGTNYFMQEVSMSINKLQTNTRLELQKLAQNNVYAVVTDANGKHWLYGYQNGLDASAGESGTGAAPGDRNGYTLTFTGSEPEDAIEVDSATFAALETAGT